jgi:hypothetical protein
MLEGVDMIYSALLILHIASGTTGLLSGAVTMAFRKGSRRHGLAGDVFVLSMLSLGVTAAVLATMRHQVGNFVGGIFTCYFVATAWLTARRRDDKAGVLDWIALMAITAIVVSHVTLGVRALLSESGKVFGAPAGAYFFTALIAALCASGDIRMLRRGLAARQRMVRHLWRMSFSWFAASGSIFIARPHLFPMVLRTTHIVALLGFLPLFFLFFWIARVRFTPADKKLTALASQRRAVSAGA